MRVCIRACVPAYVRFFPVHARKSRDRASRDLGNSGRRVSALERNETWPQATPRLDGQIRESLRSRIRNCNVGDDVK